MRTLKFLFCAACLCGVGLFAKTALTQEDVFSDEPSQPSQRPSFSDPYRPRAISDDGPFRKPLTRSDDSRLPSPAPTSLEPAAGTPGIYAPGLGGGLGSPGMPSGYGMGMPGGMMGTGGMNGAPMRERRVTRTVVEMSYEEIPKEELEAAKKLQAAIQSLKTGKDDAARKAAADIIQQQLTTQFESDLTQRERELVEVEQRVKSLREQLDKRKAAQADIINLRLQTLVNDANGLGFPDSNLGTPNHFGAEMLPAGTSHEQSSRHDPNLPAFNAEPKPVPDLLP